MIRAKRVVAYVNAEHLTLLRQHKALIPTIVWIDRWNMLLKARAFNVAIQIKQRQLPHRTAFLLFSCTIKNVFRVVFINKTHKLAARIPRCIECARFNERLNDAPICAGRIATINKIVQVQKGPVSCTFLHNGLAYLLAYATNTSKSKANALRCCSKIATRFVNIGRQNIDAFMVTRRNVVRNFIGFAHVRCKHRRHVFARKMCL